MAGYRILYDSLCIAQRLTIAVSTGGCKPCERCGLWKLLLLNELFCVAKRVIALR